jgi:hypothetical protein
MVAAFVRGLAAVIIALPLLGGAVPSAVESPATEYEVKAVFLYNFTKYVVWPAEAFQEPSTPITICVLGRDPFGKTLDETVSGESVQDRPLAVRRIDGPEQGGGCHLVFIDQTQARDVPKLLKGFDGRPVLSVGESERFAERGGMINLSSQENRIRLEINVDAARRAGLRISSQLLKLGTIVASSE